MDSNQHHWYSCANLAITIYQRDKVLSYRYDKNLLTMCAVKNTAST